MQDMQTRLENETADLRQQRDEEHAEKSELADRLKDIAAILASPLKGETSDAAAFGRDAWVYCSQHMRPHATGWCSVSPRDKVGLGVTDAKAAYEKCRAWGFPLYEDIKDKHA